MSRSSRPAEGARLPAILCAMLLAAIPAAADEPDVALFLQAGLADEKNAREALQTLEADWRDGFTPMLVDMIRLMKPPQVAGSPGATAAATGGIGGRLEADTGAAGGAAGAGGAVVDPGSPARRRLLRFLRKRTGQRFGEDLDRWRRWMWSLPYEPHSEYALFKATLYGFIDPRMIEFFPPDAATTIRLDEIDWGGVRVNGIPPLDHSPVVPSSEAGYLKDRHVVFGIELNGEARAYPRRILGWHEMARDTLGGVPLALVYCTLCGSAIPYEAQVGDELLTLGTSGLLYRSNKLMFDEQTMTLWSSLSGEPVLGTRVGSGSRLRRLPMVVTTWGEWRAAHPQTTVLSPDTGYERDYSEGAAYREYLRSAEVMFEVPGADDRLRDKDEVVGVLPAERSSSATLPLALAVDFLKRRPVYHHEDEDGALVFLTTPAGATRAYRCGAVRFARSLDGARLEDSAGRIWRIDEDGLRSESADGLLARVTTHRVFWFGWRAQYPDTRLVR